MSEKSDKAWKDYSARFRSEVIPKILSSAMFVSIGSEVGDFDVQQATELGAALLFDKPLLLVVPPGRTISTRLRRAADVVIEDWDPSDVASQMRMTEALKHLER